ncbi:hypothetical protein PVAP13_3NG163203 [Panicum virgatum]|uniref:Uncharacterized protein n=1 Tax=Panicum virgatum TaxID=38727 RepID=A0A8T0UGP8_PANVG|nr:hypothetical protein PVAP13_3NG163203 [Panicum virgatum]
MGWNPWRARRHDDLHQTRRPPIAIFGVRDERGCGGRWATAHLVCAYGTCVTRRSNGLSLGGRLQQLQSQGCCRRDQVNKGIC